MDWAQINSQNEVVNILIAEQSEIDSRNGDGFTYVQSVGDNIADIGSFYFPDTNSFSHAQPFDSWSWDQELREWVPPIAKPSDEILTKHWLDGTEYQIERWIWNESAGVWDETPA